MPYFVSFSQGNLDAAVALMQRAIEIDEKVYESEHPELAMDLDFLGELFDMQVRVSNYSLRRRILRRILVIF